MVQDVGFSLGWGKDLKELLQGYMRGLWSDY